MLHPEYENATEAEIASGSSKVLNLSSSFAMHRVLLLLLSALFVLPRWKRWFGLVNTKREIAQEQEAPLV